MGLRKKDQSTTVDLPLLPNLDAPREESREKKERKRREQEARMTPEELRLANLMGRYSPNGPFGGGLSMDYASKDKNGRKQSEASGSSSSRKW